MSQHKPKYSAQKQRREVARENARSSGAQARPARHRVCEEVEARASCCLRDAHGATRCPSSKI